MAMRCCVFLAVLLSLVLSLLKGNAANETAAPPVTAAPATTGNAANETAAPPVTAAPATTGNAANETAAPPVTAAPATTGNAANETAAPPVTAAPATTGNAANETAAPPVTAAPATTGNAANETAAPPVTAAPATTGNAANETAAPPVTAAPATTGNAANETAAPPVTAAPATTGNAANETAAPPVTAAPATTGNAANETAAPPVTAAPATTGNAANETAAPPVTAAPATTGNAANETAAPPVTAAPATTGSAGSGTSTAPPVTTTPASTGSAGSGTSTAPPVTTTPASTGSAGSGTSTAPPVTTTPASTGNLCNPDSCGSNLAQCVALHSTFICRCQYGFYYNNKDCHRGKIFPGVITLKEFYSDSVQIVNSVLYEEVFRNITTFFEDAFRNLTGFGQTVIVEIQPLKGGRASLPVRVTVANLFMENSTVDNKTVSSAIMNAAKGSSYVSDYQATTYCAVFNCDAKTTDCEENMFPKCICKSGFSKTEWDDRSCSDCSKDCSAEENKYCAKENGVPICKCMTNFEMKDENCVSCPVGYSGDNCNNNSELILIIVGTVFGAIILSLVVAVSIVSVRAERKQDPEKKSLIKSRYSNPDTSDGGRTMMFPRVQTTSGHANPGYQPNNPYEMRSSNRDRFPERDYDDLYEVSREPEGFRMHDRY